ARRGTRRRGRGARPARRAARADDTAGGARARPDGSAHWRDDHRRALGAHPTHAALQLLGPSRLLAALRLHPGRLAHRHAVRRPPVRRSDGAPRGRRLPARHRLAPPPPATRLSPDGGPTLEESPAEGLGALESGLARLETLLERSVIDTDAAKTGIQRWVTEYVSLRLQQLVPETCEHAPDDAVVDGPVLPGTRIRCTDEVLHRLARIPIPFVRQMVTQKVAETARSENVT